MTKTSKEIYPDLAKEMPSTYDETNEDLDKVEKLSDYGGIREQISSEISDDLYEDISIKGKEVLEQVKRRIRKVIMGIGVVGISAGSVSCGSHHVKSDDENTETAISVDDDDVEKTFDTVYLSKNLLPQNDVVYSGRRFNRSIENGTAHGLPLRKHAENPDDPDSLLVESEKEYVFIRDDGTGFYYPAPTQSSAKGKYLAIDPEDKDKQFEISYIGFGDVKKERGKKGKTEVITVEQQSNEYLPKGHNKEEKVYKKVKGRKGKEKVHIGYRVK